MGRITGIVVAILLLIALVCDAVASEYLVAYAIELDGDTATGRLTCDFDRSCSGAFDPKVAAIIFVKPRSPFTWEISLLAPRGCCLFADGQRSHLVSPASKIYEPIFVGRGRVGNEYIINNRVGTLTLVFQHR
jgi:hypothetical protein